MKYYYKRPEHYIPLFGKIYTCNHYLYSHCTLFLLEEKGLAVIQQKFDRDTKNIYWAELDPWLANDIFLNDGFEELFYKYSEESVDGLYPTITVRKLMWALKMKPLKRELWEDSQKFLIL